MVTFATPTGTNNIGILGIGACRPQRLVTNEEICGALGVDSDWIYTRTGIRARRFCGRDENITTMSIAAGRAALANSGLTGADIDALIWPPAPTAAASRRPRRRWPLLWGQRVPAMDLVWAAPVSVTQCRSPRT